MPFVKVAGHSLHYEWFGTVAENRPVLVFLHDGLGSVEQWHDFPARLAEASGCPALAYDRYGHGKSEILAEPRRGVRFMHDEALTALPQFLTSLGVENPVLVGHSDGASIALVHAGAGHPVRGLAVMAPHVFVEPICITSVQAAAKAFESTDLPAKLAHYHIDARRTFYGWADVWLDPAFSGWSIEEYLPAIKCPLLAIQGEDDDSGTMAQLDAIAGKVSGACELVKLDRCGHSPFRDRSDAVLEALRRFVEKLP
jgi:pimeloyl-ACP methyl ester carboxylesterase